tara:strand:- start:14 stop:388 length:375 start_codon:yes stop_codon:yes gene_type:complete
MIFYTKYNTSNGIIISNGGSNCPVNEVHLESGQSIIEGTYTSDLYKIVSGSPVELDISGVMQATIRAERNLLLNKSDWTQIADSPLTDAKKVKWVTYRQALRDLPANNSSATSIDDVVFPTEPT